MKNLINITKDAVTGVVTVILKSVYNYDFNHYRGSTLRSFRKGHGPRMSRRNALKPDKSGMELAYTSNISLAHFIHKVRDITAETLIPYFFARFRSMKFKDRKVVFTGTGFSTVKGSVGIKGNFEVIKSTKRKRNFWKHTVKFRNEDIINAIYKKDTYYYEEEDGPLPALEEKIEAIEDTLENFGKYYGEKDYRRRNNDWIATGDCYVESKAPWKSEHTDHTPTIIRCNWSNTWYDRDQDKDVTVSGSNDLRLWVREHGSEARIVNSMDDSKRKKLLPLFKKWFNEEVLESCSRKESNYNYDKANEGRQTYAEKKEQRENVINGFWDGKLNGVLADEVEGYGLRPKYYEGDYKKGIFESELTLTPKPNSRLYDRVSISYDSKVDTYEVNNVDFKNLSKEDMAKVVEIYVNGVNNTYPDRIDAYKEDRIKRDKAREIRAKEKAEADKLKWNF